MNCYSCDNFMLRPVKLSAGLPARQCSKCGGTHIDLLSYRAWRDHYDLKIENHETGKVATNDNQKALVCQRCSKIMLKYKITGKSDNYVDFCMTCDDVWLDGGEWLMLVQLELEEKLAHILTEPWQRALKQEFFQQEADQKYIDMFGQEEFDCLIEMANWLKNSDDCEDRLQFLRQRVKI